MPVALVINGPNLNLLGFRRPDLYGSTTLAHLEGLCRGWGEALGWRVETFSTNHEGDLVDRLHEARGAVDGVVLNAGALSHYSYSLHDAIEALEAPVVEVHISNVVEREPWRRQSVIAPACVASIYGRGIDGYRHALSHLALRREWPGQLQRYGEHHEQIGDLRVPDVGGARAAVVIIHGGFWRHMWKRDLMDAIAVDLARRGLVTWNVEYRLLGSGGGYPDTFADVAAAVDYLARVPQVDQARVAVLGHSAGGHLALWAVARSHLPPGRAGAQPLIRPRLAVGLAAICDLAADPSGGAARELAGDAPLTEVSPLHMPPPEASVLLAHGAGDDRVPVEQSRSYQRATSTAGGDCELIEAAEGDHFAYLDTNEPVWQAVAERITLRLAAG